MRALAAASPDLPAARLRSEGNAAFAAQQHSRAIELYTAALHEAGGDAEAKGVLWSNVSACHAANADYGRALDAAREATRLRPDWAKVKGKGPHAGETSGTTEQRPPHLSVLEGYPFSSPLARAILELASPHACNS